MKKKYILILLLTFFLLLILIGNYILRFSDIPLRGYSFSVSRINNNTPFEHIYRYYLYYDFKTETGNISFDIYDKNIDSIRLGLPGWCNQDRFKEKNVYDIEYPKKFKINSGIEVYNFYLNLSCPGMPSNARIGLFLNGNYTGGDSSPEEYNSNPIFMEFILPDSIKCKSECVGLEYTNIDSIRIQNFENKIKLYSIRGLNEHLKVVQFYIKTYRVNFIFWSNLLRDLGISLLASAIFYILSSTHKKKGGKIK